MNRYAQTSVNSDWWTANAPDGGATFATNTSATPRPPPSTSPPTPPNGARPDGSIPQPGDPDYVAAPDPTQPPPNAPPPPTTAPPATTPLYKQWDALAQSRDWQGLFKAITAAFYPNANAAAGGLLNPSSPLAIQLAKYGFKISPANAAGEVTKIQTPDSHWVRVLGGPKGGYDYTWVDNGAEGSGGGDVNVGAVPSNFGNPLALPDYLKNPYVAPQWTGGDFRAPTMAEVEATPGYMERFGMGVQASDRSAAAKGTVLAGGQQKALTRYGQDYATNEYENTFKNNYQQYMTKYGQFLDSSSAGLGARNQNVNEYLMNYNIDHTQQTDYWSRLFGLYGIGASTAAGTKPPGA